MPPPRRSLPPFSPLACLFYFFSLPFFFFFLFLYLLLHFLLFSLFFFFFLLSFPPSFRPSLPQPPPFCASLPLPPSSSLFSSFSASLPRTHLSFLVSSSSALEVLSWSRLRRLELILLLFLESLVRFSCCAGRAPPFCRFVHHVSCVRR